MLVFVIDDLPTRPQKLPSTDRPLDDIDRLCKQLRDSSEARGRTNISHVHNIDYKWDINYPKLFVEFGSNLFVIIIYPNIQDVWWYVKLNLLNDWELAEVQINRLPYPSIHVWLSDVELELVAWDWIVCCKKWLNETWNECWTLNVEGQSIFDSIVVLLRSMNAILSYVPCHQHKLKRNAFYLVGRIRFHPLSHSLSCQTNSICPFNYDEYIKWFIGQRWRHLQQTNAAVFWPFPIYILVCLFQNGLIKQEYWSIWPCIACRHCFDIKKWSQDIHKFLTNGENKLK